MPKRAPSIVSFPPGLKGVEEVAKDDKVISPSTFRAYPMAVESGKGCIIKDVDGNEYIDLNSGMLSLSIGHSCPEVVNAIKVQAERLIHYPYTNFYCPPVTELARKLLKLAPLKGPKKVLFCSDGSCAVEASVRMIQWFTRKHQFLAYLGSFHGTTAGSLSLTAPDPVRKKHFSQAINVVHVPYPYCYRCFFNSSFPECGLLCLEAIERLVKEMPIEDVAAFYAEPIQVDAGCVVPPPRYFDKLGKILKDYGVLFVVDETRTSFGRAGRWFAISYWEVEPDAILLGSSMASGIPLGAVVAKEELMDWEPGAYSTLSGGNPLACAAAMAVIESIREEHLIENSVYQGSYVSKRLKEMQEKYAGIGEVRGKGLLLGVELVKNRESKVPAEREAKEIERKVWRKGVALAICGKSTLMIAPPISISKDLLDSALRILEGAFKEVLK
ncbi:TPA: aminotransferase class III-fold pyridoxal phosphate-dependent enzyme [Candidatus Bathyarchaeota archaeon]|nr:aminotransferase class III-fold pyridoxal phosphate-dependent enzyme [Candidatus Bathyarchaeota archaeon]